MERGTSRVIGALLYLEKVYRTRKIIVRHVVANLWRRLAAITLSGGKVLHPSNF